MTQPTKPDNHPPPDTIIAPTQQIGRDYAALHRIAPGQARIVTKSEQLRGLHDVTYVTTGHAYGYQLAGAAARQWWDLQNEAKTLEQFGHLKPWSAPKPKKKRKARKAKK